METEDLKELIELLEKNANKGNTFVQVVMAIVGTLTAVGIVSIIVLYGDVNVLKSEMKDSKVQTAEIKKCVETIKDTVLIHISQDNNKKGR